MAKRGEHSTPDAIDLLCEVVGCTRAELVMAIVRESHRAWLRELRKVIREQQELGGEDDDPWTPE